MGRFRKTGGETVSSGMYWNFETGKKVNIQSRGILPGKPSDSYYKAPPLLILAGAAAAAHFFMYLLPKYFVQFYSAFADSLVTAYVIFDYTVIGLALIGLFAAGVKDVFGRTWSMPSFQWRPGISYLYSEAEEDDIRRSRNSDMADDDK